MRARLAIRRVLVFGVVAAACWTSVSLGEPPATRVPPPPVAESERDYMFPPMPPSPLKGHELIENVLKVFPEVDPDELMSFVHKEFPMEMRQVGELSKKHMERAFELLAGVIRESQELIEIREDDPKLFELRLNQLRLERRATLLAEECLVSKPPEREVKIKELELLLTKAFENKQALMRLDVKRMQSQLSDLQALIDRRASVKNAIVSSRMLQITGEREGLEW